MTLKCKHVISNTQILSPFGGNSNAFPPISSKYCRRNTTLLEHFKIPTIWILHNILKKCSQKMLPAHNKIKKTYFQIPIWSTFGRIFRNSTKYTENAKTKTLYTYSKIQIFFDITICPIFWHHTNNLSPNVQPNSKEFS